MKQGISITKTCIDKRLVFLGCPFHYLCTKHGDAEYGSVSFEYSVRS